MALSRTEEIGRVLAGRYRIIAPIGRGASAQVFLADDVTLKRRVALKMLHDALADDAAFLRRFQAEAQSAAALNHPNVMAVYDWGQDPDGDVPFLVLEYLAGGSLRSMLDRGARLTQSQALLVGLEATRALEYAHRRGFVHRDIKPANLLFGEEGRLRIADFGLARALAEAAWTEPQGAVLGTARYASPEQAQGRALTGKADVYSLALVLVEAVTGQVPFAADTTIGTLMARVDRDLQVPEELGALRSALERAGRADPDERVDAHDLAVALMATAGRMPRPTTLPLAGAVAADGPEEDPDPTLLAPGPDATVPVVEPTTAATVAEPPTVAGTGAPTAAHDGPTVDAGDAPTVAAGTTGGAATDAAGGDDEDPLEVWPFVTAATAAPDADVPTVEPPTELQASPGSFDLTGVLDDEGRDDLASADLDLTTPLGGAARAHDPAGDDRTTLFGDLDDGEIDDDRTTLFDDVGDQDRTAAFEPVVVPPRGPVPPIAPPPAPAPEPAAAQVEEKPPRRPRSWKRWALVAFVLVLLVAVGVSAGALVADLTETPSHDVPTVIGLDVAAARERLAANDWKIVEERTRRDGTDAGQVLDVTPKPGASLREGERVTLLVSDGQTMAVVPDDLVGQPVADATAKLEGTGFEVRTEKVFSEDVETDRVVSLADGTKRRLEKGSTVGLVVSKGPEPRTIPGELAGKPEEEVVGALNFLRLTPRVDRVFDETVKAGIVIRTDPAGGAQVPRGAEVVVTVSKGPELVEMPDISRTKDLDDATELLESKGFEVEVQGPVRGKPVRTDPAAGEMVRKGSTVTLILRGRG